MSSIPPVVPSLTVSQEASATPAPREVWDEDLGDALARPTESVVPASSMPMQTVDLPLVEETIDATAFSLFSELQSSKAIGMCRLLWVLCARHSHGSYLSRTFHFERLHRRLSNFCGLRDET